MRTFGRQLALVVGLLALSALVIACAVGVSRLPEAIDRFFNGS